MKRFSNELNAAIEKYGESHVDLVLEDDYVYGIYHSKNNSFEVTSKHPRLVDVDYSRLSEKLSIGLMEI